MLALERIKDIISNKLDNGVEIIDTLLAQISESEGVESTYKDTEIECMLENLALSGLIGLDVVERNPKDYYWLGDRRRIITSFVKKFQEMTDIGQPFEDALMCSLDYYVLNKKYWTEERIYLLQKVSTLYHGSVSKINRFEPRKESAGDLRELVYFSADEDFALCFTMNNKRLTKQINIDSSSFERCMNFKGHDLKSLIVRHDVGGYLHSVSGEEKSKFGLIHSKGSDEFCSSQEVFTSNVVLVPSALNELILNCRVSVFVSSKNIEDVISSRDGEVTPKMLLETRQQIIEELKKNSDRNKEENETLERLEKQQLDAIRILEEHGDYITNANRVLLNHFRSIYQERGQSR